MFDPNANFLEIFRLDDDDPNEDEYPVQELDLLSTMSHDYQDEVFPIFNENQNEEPPPDRLEDPPRDNQSLIRPPVDFNYVQEYTPQTHISTCILNFPKFKNQCGVALFSNSSNEGFGFNCMEGRFFWMNQKHPKRKISLSDDQKKFKDQFYAIFEKGKKFDKSILKKIHEFMKEELKIPSILREEYRRIDLYFKHFYEYKDIIIPFLKKNKKDILNKCF